MMKKIYFKKLLKKFYYNFFFLQKLKLKSFIFKMLINKQFKKIIKKNYLKKK